MQEASWATHSYWLYTILIDKSLFGKNSRELLGELQDLDIQTRPLWQPLHLSKAHKSQSEHHCPVSEKLASSSLSLPSSVGLDQESQQVVIDAIKSIHSTNQF